MREATPLPPPARLPPRASGAPSCQASTGGGPTPAPGSRRFQPRFQPHFTPIPGASGGGGGADDSTGGTGKPLATLPMGAGGHPGQSHLILPPGRGLGGRCFQCHQRGSHGVPGGCPMDPPGVQVATLLRYADILAYTFLLE
ncbi:uncharacterized protein ACIBXB_005941 [Morphnus guianensis]